MYAAMIRRSIAANTPPMAHHNPVDGRDLPVPRFGVRLPMET
jgi:hypothetical protein